MFFAHIESTLQEILVWVNKTLQLFGQTSLTHIASKCVSDAKGDELSKFNGVFPRIFQVQQTISIGYLWSVDILLLTIPF